MVEGGGFGFTSSQCRLRCEQKVACQAALHNSRSLSCELWSRGLATGALPPSAPGYTTRLRPVPRATQPPSAPAAFEMHALHVLGPEPNSRPRIPVRLPCVIDGICPELDPAEAQQVAAAVSAFRIGFGLRMHALLPNVSIELRLPDIPLALSDTGHARLFNVTLRGPPGPKPRLGLCSAHS